MPTGINPLAEPNLAYVFYGVIRELSVKRLTRIAYPRHSKRPIYSFNLLRPSDSYMCQWTHHQAITWTNAGILLIGPLGTNFGEI